MEMLEELSKYYRKELFEKFVSVGQGHPGSTFSMLDIVVTLYHAGFIRFDLKDKKFLDKLIISKGHATVAVYPILVKLCVIDQKEWDNWGYSNSSLRVFGNISIPGIDATTGSLGHGVGIGAGMALAYKRMGLENQVFVIISEGELYEGSTWEGLLFAAHHKLNNLTVIIDINSLIILGGTDDCLRLNSIKDKFSGWGFNMAEVDGHETQDIRSKLNQLKNSSNGMTNLIFAKTIKGKGLSIMENKPNWHYWNPLTEEQIEFCRKELI